MQVAKDVQSISFRIVRYSEACIPVNSCNYKENKGSPCFKGKKKTSLSTKHTDVVLRWKSTLNFASWLTQNKADRGITEMWTQMKKGATMFNSENEPTFCRLRTSISFICFLKPAINSFFCFSRRLFSANNWSMRFLSCSPESCI